MKYRKIDNVIAARLEIGEEIIGSLEQICRENNVRSAIVHAIGAVSSATVAMFDFACGEYRENELDRFMELIALEGNVTEMNGETYIHLHACFGDEDGRAFGGHLKKAVIGATCEMFIEPLSKVISRVRDDETGLNIFNI